MPHARPTCRRVAAAVVEAIESRRLLSAFTVTSTADVGPGSLRDALTLANASPGPDRIEFAIPGSGAHTIQPATKLPTITDSLVIDGYTQPGSSPNTNPPGTTPNAVQTIRLDGSLLLGLGRVGLRFTAGNSTLRGMSIFGVSPGVRMAGDNNVIEGNAIAALAQFDDGVNHRAGGLTPAQVNVVSGIGLLGSNSVVEGNLAAAIGVSGSGNLIGGRTPAARNVIGPGFGGGVQIGGSNNRVEGNYIGTDVTGTQRNHNRRAAVFIEGNGNTIGGTEPGTRNLISGSERGVYIFDASNNVIQGNWIGLDVNGHATLPNTADGVMITGTGVSSGNVIGGTAPGAGNVISGNGEGIGIFLGATGNIVQGNLIGVLPDGVTPAGNNVEGIFLASNASNNLIGGTEPGAGNVIAYTTGLTGDGAGVLVGKNASITPLGNAILGNRIFGNAKLGIDLTLDPDLHPDGVTPNDPGDTDSGPNNDQNFPVLTSAQTTAAGTAGTRVTGTLNSSPGATFRLEFFASPSADPSGAGEGQQFLGETTVTTDGNGNASFDATLPTSAAVGHVVAATATDASNDTSEFSRAVAVTAKPNLAPRFDRPNLPGFATDSVGPQREPGHGLWRELIEDAEQTS